MTEQIRCRKCGHSEYYHKTKTGKCKCKIGATRTCMCLKFEPVSETCLQCGMLQTDHQMIMIYGSPYYFCQGQDLSKIEINGLEGLKRFSDGCSVKW